MTQEPKPKGREILGSFKCDDIPSIVIIMSTRNIPINMIIFGSRSMSYRYGRLKNIRMVAIVVGDLRLILSSEVVSNCVSSVVDMVSSAISGASPSHDLIVVIEAIPTAVDAIWVGESVGIFISGSGVCRNRHFGLE